METIETELQHVIDMLQKLNGAPALLLVGLVCIITGYALKWVKKFPNEGIPLAVIFMGGVVYPFVADANNDIPLRVWIIRNAMIGLVVGFVAWLVHNKFISKIEDRITGRISVSNPPNP